VSPLGEQMSLYPSRCRLVVHRERSDGNRDGAGHAIIFVVALLAPCIPLRTRGAQWDREVPCQGGGGEGRALGGNGPLLVIHLLWLLPVCRVVASDGEPLLDRSSSTRRHTLIAAVDEARRVLVLL
jgi:hypothetical protein